MKRRRLTQSAVRRLALALPEVVEGAHFRRPDFRVRNRVFATLPPDAGIVVLKSLPTNVDALVSSDSATFWNEWRGRWVGVRLERVTLAVLRELVADAWRVAAPRHLAATLK